SGQTSNGLLETKIRMTGPAASGTVPPGAYELRLRSLDPHPRTVNSWFTIVDADVAAFANPSDGLRIGAPGGARKAITVGAYVSRSTWPVAHQPDQTDGLTEDVLASFSADGPLLDGTIKPDLVAPGAMIVAACPRTAKPTRYHPDRDLRAMAGTSMS